jgi:UDP-glucose 4-epimerase
MGRHRAVDRYRIGEVLMETDSGGAIGGPAAAGRGGAVRPVGGRAGTVLVTGAAGFLGRAVVRRLAAGGARVVAVDDESAGLRLRGGGAVVAVRGDVRDGDLLESGFARFRPDAVVHLAALHFIPACERDPRSTLDVNVSGTQAVIDACARRPPGTLFFASTADVYSHAVPLAHEGSAVDPVGVYGLSKLVGERLLRDQAARLGGCRTVVGRLFNLYGPGDPHPHLVPEVVRQLRAGRALALGDLSGSRDFVYVQDAAVAVVGLLGVGVCGTFNISTGTATPVGEVVARLCRLAGRDPGVVAVAERMRPGQRRDSAGDPARLVSALGSWRPVELGTGLARTLTEAGSGEAGAAVLGVSA